MSELKGTILGIILTLIVFGTVSTVVTASFNSLALEAGTRMDNLTAELSEE